MKEHLTIYFSKIGLTATSANTIANKAKEYISTQEERLNQITLLNTTVSLLSSGVEKTISVGNSEDELIEIEEKLTTIAKLKSLIGWLREAIKAKKELSSEIDAKSIQDWAKENDIELPVLNLVKPMTNEEYMSTLSIKDRYEMIDLQTHCAVLGKFIHPSGAFNEARKELAKRIANPNEIKGEGANTMIYSYLPSCDERAVDAAFFSISNSHREMQAKLNKMLHEMDVALEESCMKAYNENAKNTAEHKIAMDEIYNKFNKWKLEKSQEIAQYKIVIPTSLKSAYDFINKL